MHIFQANGVQTASSLFTKHMGIIMMELLLSETQA